MSTEFLTTANNVWEIENTISSHVPITPNHSLHINLAGPQRTTSDKPLVIIIPGFSSSSREWVVVHRLASTFSRTLLYDRSGLGRSSESQNPITATSIAAELSSLLNATGLAGPYVLIGHSYGGIIAREFLHLRPTDVVGMVFVDANQELNTVDHPWPKPFVQAMIAGLDSLSVTGLSQNHKLSPEEWRAYLGEESTEKHARTEAKEFLGYAPSGPALAAKRQLQADPPVLGNRPVSVLKGSCASDFEKFYRAGLEHGNGTTEDRQLYLQMLETYDEIDTRWQREILKLSRVTNWSNAYNSGHNVHMTEPEAVVRELRWVLDNLEVEPQRPLKASEI